MSGQKPSHVVVVYDRNDYATRVGVAWPLKNGGGFSLTIHPGVSVSSMDGARIVVIEDKPKEDRQQRDGGDRGRE